MADQTESLREEVDGLELMPKHKLQLAELDAAKELLQEELAGKKELLTKIQGILNFVNWSAIVFFGLFLLADIVFIALGKITPAERYINQNVIIAFLTMTLGEFATIAITAVRGLFGSSSLAKIGKLSLINRTNGVERENAE